MYLTGKNRGFFKKEIVFTRDDGYETAVFRVEGMRGVLTLADGTQHFYLTDLEKAANGVSLGWTSGGQDICVIDPLNPQTMLDGLAYGGHRYGLKPEEGKNFTLLRGGQSYGLIERKGFLGGQMTVQSSRDIPVEIVGALAYLAMIYGALGVLGALR
ncbi:MAG: hypothetical protein RBS08_06805 [Bdellovibrionales bacterium]|jgi:hypothetical protein|nr:hypothetical protein [Bdellovibrionales bacterium]